MLVEKLQTLAGKKKGQKSGNIKKKNTKSKKPTNRKSKAPLSHNGSDLSTKLLTTMDKHKEVWNLQLFTFIHKICLFEM